MSTANPPPPPPAPPPAPPAPPAPSRIENELLVTAPMAAPPRQPQSWFRRFAALWGFAAFLVLVAYLFRGVLVPMIFAVIIAYILAPAVDRLSRPRIGRFHLPRGLAVVFIYLMVLAFAAIFFIAFL